LWTGKTLPAVPRTQRRNEVTLFVARKGAGKSTRALDELARRDSRRWAFVWDPVGWFPRVIGGRVTIEANDPQQWLTSARPSQPSIVRFVGAPVDSAHWLVAIAWAFPGSLIVWDEAGQLMPYGVAEPWLRVAITQARHRAVSLWFLAQRVTILDRLVVANADRAVVGPLGYARDRKAMAEEFDAPELLEFEHAKPGTFRTFKR
jgi:hypothetical protein